MGQTRLGKNERLSDVAQALGLSESTVSRALSGKGRVSETTRRSVAEYIRRSGYRPNMIAKGLAQKKTYNFCAVMPEESVSLQMPFFQNCLMGICEAAAEHDYDVVITTVSPADCARLRRMIAAGKADGYILLRSVVRDAAAALLRERALPFVLIGSCGDETVAQVDTDNEAAARRLTAALLADGVRRPALLLGDMRYLVNLSRQRGFDAALRDAALDAARLFPGLRTEAEIASALDKALADGCDAVFCGDDYICALVLARLRRLEREIPLASFYNSELLQYLGSVRAAETTDAHTLGREAVCRLLGMLGE